MVLFKGWFDYKLIEQRLKEEEDLRINFISLLMEVKPYRRSILNQIYNKEHILHVSWSSMEYEAKMDWIKKEMFNKWTKDEFVAHIIKSIKLLRFNKMYRESFKVILGEEIK